VGHSHIVGKVVPDFHQVGVVIVSLPRRSAIVCSEGSTSWTRSVLVSGPSRPAFCFVLHLVMVSVQIAENSRAADTNDRFQLTEFCFSLLHSCLSFLTFSIEPAIPTASHRFSGRDSG
jgi:hypothetical protein